MTPVEEQAGSTAQRFLTLVEAGARDELVEFTRTLTPDEVVLALLAIASSLLEQETANDVLAERLKTLTKSNNTFDIANAQLFSDRKKLLNQVAELREIQKAQTARITVLREQLEERKVA